MRRGLWGFPPSALGFTWQPVEGAVEGGGAVGLVGVGRRPGGSQRGSRPGAMGYGPESGKGPEHPVPTSHRLVKVPNNGSS